MLKFPSQMLKMYGHLRQMHAMYCVFSLGSFLDRLAVEMCDVTVRVLTGNG